MSQPLKTLVSLNLPHTASLHGTDLVVILSVFSKTRMTRIIVPGLQLLAPSGPASRYYFVGKRIIPGLHILSDASISRPACPQTYGSR
ncbi:hypothetical protein PHLCEN_2v13121 [Hermanssonia centrifuga]|uniref:Uncharacterized protein n=1 Tax=Hermanssonia centrifuga TaxID=98765 RepID=A0A2R6NF56_9APHY|nr:hypothetical protein PHLCEN_2v13121 [Hermanssonia centrifuga]